MDGRLDEILDQLGQWFPSASESMISKFFQELCGFPRFLAKLEQWSSQLVLKVKQAEDSTKDLQNRLQEALSLEDKLKKEFEEEKRSLKDHSEAQAKKEQESLQKELADVKAEKVDIEKRMNSELEKKIEDAKDKLLQEFRQSENAAKNEKESLLKELEGVKAEKTDVEKRMASELKKQLEDAKDKLLQEFQRSEAEARKEKESLLAALEGIKAEKIDMETRMTSELKKQLEDAKEKLSQELQENEESLKEKGRAEERSKFQEEEISIRNAAEEEAKKQTQSLSFELKRAQDEGARAREGVAMASEDRLATLQREDEVKKDMKVQLQRLEEEADRCKREWVPGRDTLRLSSDGKVWEDESKILLEHLLEALRERKNHLTLMLPLERCSLNLLVTPIPAASRSSQGQFDAAFLQADFQDEQGTVFSSSQLRIESKGGKNGRCAYADKVVLDLEELRRRESPRSVDLVFISWNQKVSDPDRATLYSKGIMVFDAVAQEPHGYGRMFEQILATFSMLITQHARRMQADTPEIQQKLSGYRCFVASMVKSSCDRLVEDVKILGSHPEGSAGFPKNFWAQLLGAINKDFLLEAAKFLVGKVDSTRATWTRDFCEALCRCLSDLPRNRGVSRQSEGTVPRKRARKS